MTGEGMSFGCGAEPETIFHCMTHGMGLHLVYTIRLSSVILEIPYCVTQVLNCITTVISPLYSH